MAAFAVAIDIRDKIKKIIIPCTVGYLVPMILEDDPEYKNISYMERAWIFRYSLELPDGQVLTDCLGPYISKELFDIYELKALPQAAFVDPENFKNNCPYLQKVLWRYRVSSQPVNEGNI